MAPVVAVPIQRALIGLPHTRPQADCGATSGLAAGPGPDYIAGCRQGARAGMRRVVCVQPRASAQRARSRGGWQAVACRVAAVVAASAAAAGRGAPDGPVPEPSAAALKRCLAPR